MIHWNSQVSHCVVGKPADRDGHVNSTLNNRIRGRVHASWHISMAARFANRATLSCCARHGSHRRVMPANQLVPSICRALSAITKEYKLQGIPLRCGTLAPILNPLIAAQVHECYTDTDMYPSRCVDVFERVNLHNLTRVMWLFP